MSWARLRWLPFGVLLVLGALMSFRLGWARVHLTESHAIEAYAARYMDQSGAPAADCHGAPGEDVWIVVICGPDGAQWRYHVNRFGGLVAEFAPGAPRDHANPKEPTT